MIMVGIINVSHLSIFIFIYQIVTQSKIPKIVDYYGKSHQIMEILACFILFKYN